ncbi:MAG: ABC transporter substrate-binding protein [Candidatus Methanoplasma sp.]|jgi:iron complex transport system substrate-binding protein|nr:ABC transporter substrate-binding protein [Candidatus Methanoplasma sp.]
MNSKILAAAAVAIIVAAGAAAFIVVNGNGGGRGGIDTELQVYGNANGDWRIDQKDVDALREIISGDREAGKYADANRDGDIDERDVEFVESIIAGTNKTIHIVDGDGRDVKVRMGAERVAAEYYSNVELMLILGQADKVVAVDNAPYQCRDFYFGKGSSVRNLVNMNAPDYEMVEKMDLDVLLTFTYAGTAEKANKLTDVDVVYLGMYRPNVEDPEKSEYVQGILKAGYMFGAADRAEAYVNWLMGIRDEIAGKTSGIGDGDRPRVLMTNFTSSYLQTGVETTEWSVYTSIDPMGQSAVLAGGHPVAMDVLTPDQYAGGAERTLYGVKVSPESIVSAKIDYAFLHCVKYTYGGTVAAGPDHGYAVSDRSQMDAARDLAASRDLADIGEIRVIAGDFRNGASGCMLLAAYMAKILHPELFADMDPLEYHQQYVEDWMGIKGYDVRTDGVFISPSV